MNLIALLINLIALLTKFISQLLKFAGWLLNLIAELVFRYSRLVSRHSIKAALFDLGKTQALLFAPSDFPIVFSRYLPTEKKSLYCRPSNFIIGKCRKR